MVDACAERSRSDPPKVAYRSSFQTALWCFCLKGQEWLSNKEKALLKESGTVKGDERK